MVDSKVKELIEEVEVKNPTIYEYADAYLTCHKCGAEFKLFENVKGGMRVDLFTTDQHKLILHCTECDNKMEIGFKNAANPPVEEPEILEDDTQNTSIPEGQVLAPSAEPTISAQDEQREPQIEGASEDCGDEVPKESMGIQDAAEADVEIETANAIEGLKEVGQVDLATEIEDSLNKIG